MSFTTLLWVALYGGSILAAFLANPAFGALGYLLEYYMRPELKWWGDELPALRYNLIVSLALGASFVLQRDSLRKMVSVKNYPLRWLLALAGIMLVVTATVAVNTETSWSWSVQWFKMAVIFPMLIVGVVRTTNAFNWFVGVHMAGAAWWGWDAWTRPRRSQGRLISIGSGDSLNDNAASAHLLTVVPFILVFLLVEKDKRLRALALVALPFVVNTIVLCNSRGALVGIALAIGASMFLIRTGYRLRLVGAAIGLGLTLLFLADDTFIRRQQTTADYEDNSAQERLQSWLGAVHLVQDHPLGTGGRGFHMLSPVYIPQIVEAHGGDLRAPHNTIGMVASEWGIAGLICFIGLHVWIFQALRRIKQRSEQGDPGHYWRALAIQLALIAHLGASLFTDRFYGEAGYWMIGLAFALYRMQATDLAESTLPAAAAQSAQSPNVAGTWPLAGATAR